MTSAVRLFAVVFILQCLLLVGTALLMSNYGGNLAHEISTQDAREYMLLGDQLLADGTFHLPGVATPETWRTPGYPFFVALVFFFTHSSLPALLVVLALLGGATSALTYLIGAELGLSSRLSTLGAFLFGISPAVIWIPASGMGGDILFIFLLTLAIYLLLRSSRENHVLRFFFLAGLTLGAATLVRPIGLYLSPLLILAVPFLTPGNELKKALRCIGAAVIGFVILVLPWYVRNEVVTGHFEFTSQFAFNPFYYNIPSFYASKNGTSLGVEQQKLMDSIGAKEVYSVVNGFEYADQLSTVERHFIKENFFPYFAFHTYKTIPFFVGSGMNVIYATITNEVPTFYTPFFPTAGQNTSSLFYGGSYGEVLKNLLYYWPSTLERLIWLALFILVFTAPFVTHGRQRRFAILGIIFILAVAFLASPIEQPRYRIPAELFIWLSALLALSNLNFVKRIYEKIETSVMPPITNR